MGLPYLKARLGRFSQKTRETLKLVLFAVDAAGLLFKLAYIYHRTAAFSLPMRLGGMQYVRSAAQTGASLMPLESWVGTGLFLVRFADWWRTQSGLDQPAGRAPAIPPPPAAGGGPKKGRCALCQLEIVGPVATPAGRVYCSACILAHLAAHGNRCPVTDDVLEPASDLLAVYLE